jgi:hypothetical protein
VSPSAAGQLERATVREREKEREREGKRGMESPGERKERERKGESELLPRKDCSRREAFCAVPKFTAPGVRFGRCLLVRPGAPSRAAT